MQNFDRLLKRAIRFAPNRNLQCGIVRVLLSQSRRQLPKRDRCPVQSDGAVEADRDDSFIRRTGDGAHFGYRRYINFDPTLGLAELAADHEKDYQQKHDVDHRRQIYRCVFGSLSANRHVEFGFSGVEDSRLSLRERGVS